MGNMIVYNGELIQENELHLSATNRSFRYGDGVFETIRCQKGVPLWFDYHFERLEKSARILHMKLPGDFLPDLLTQKMQQLAISNGCLEGARIRLSLFRGDGGFYKPATNDAAYLMEISALKTGAYEFNYKGLYVDVFDQIVKTYSPISGLKASSALVYVMASLYAQEKGWDDVVVLNETGHIVEATSSNIFMVEKGVLYTPALDQACVEGVMRRVLIEIAQKQGIKVVECALLPGDLLKADEVFLSNAIMGIQWVKGLKDKRYYHDFSSHLFQSLKEESVGL
jgi:aminodeoxychorismate lyase